MGIKSTQDITREDAIHRIEDILSYLRRLDYDRLHSESFEPNEKMVDVWDVNELLGDVLDLPFFRKSMFENYNVVNELDTSE